MLIKKPEDVRSSEITDEKLYRNRREFLKTAGLGVVATAGGILAAAGCANPGTAAAQGSEFDTDERLTPYEDVTSYNNFYEFGTDKGDPVRYAERLTVTPWTVEVDGLVNESKKWDLDDLLRGLTMEDRIYRMRCVEGWSMVIPWHGVSLAALIRKLEPQPNARFIQMETLYRPNEMIGQRPGIFGDVLDWPYVEGLRMDEAMNPLTMMAVGVYGKPGPNQNGAPLRLVTPWKYGFKGVKSIVKISFVRDQPRNTWQVMAPHEYGFYANVNPNVSHPRWSQARERRIGELFRRETLMFNGYTEQVAHMYEGLDLRRNY